MYTFTCSVHREALQKLIQLVFNDKEKHKHIDVKAANTYNKSYEVGNATQFNIYLCEESHIAKSSTNLNANDSMDFSD